MRRLERRKSSQSTVILISFGLILMLSNTTYTWVALEKTMYPIYAKAGIANNNDKEKEEQERHNSNNNSNSNSNTTLPTLDELVQTITNSTHNYNYSCPDGMVPFPDTPLPSASIPKKIPSIVHITAKTRCVPPNIFNHLKQWEFAGHALYFHDDEAVNRLMKYAIMDNDGKGLVPNLEKVMSCVTSGATLSDIWRYTILWYYGGIYTDLDNSPREFNGATIQPDDDSFFTIEQLGIMSQYFFASSPQHPLMMHVLNMAIVRLATKSSNVMINHPAQRTGPRALKFGFVLFRNAVGVYSNGYIPAGIYEGALHEDGALYSDDNNLIFIDNTTQADITSRNITNNNERRHVTVVGNKANSKQYVNRGGLGRAKMKYMNDGGMPHYLQDYKDFGGQPVSCQGHISKQEDRINTLNLTLTGPTGAYPRYQKANYIKSETGLFVDGNDPALPVVLNKNWG